eukprot:365352-Chlamydomonas_euryale.AAC.4
MAYSGMVAWLMVPGCAAAWWCDAALPALWPHAWSVDVPAQPHAWSVDVPAQPHAWSVDVPARPHTQSVDVPAQPHA